MKMIVSNQNSSSHIVILNS